MAEAEIETIRCVVGATIDGAPTWWIYDASDHMLAWAGDEFDTEDQAAESLEEYQILAARARYASHRLPGGWWQWRAWHRGRILAVSADNHASSSSAREAADTLRARVLALPEHS
jgi:hypothetical protein